MMGQKASRGTGFLSETQERATVDSTKGGREKKLQAERAVCAKTERWKKMTVTKQPRCLLQGCTSRGDFGSKAQEVTQASANKNMGNWKDTKGSWNPRMIQPGFRDLTIRGQSPLFNSPPRAAQFLISAFSCLTYFCLSLFLDF